MLLVLQYVRAYEYIRCAGGGWSEPHCCEDYWQHCNQTWCSCCRMSSFIHHAQFFLYFLNVFLLVYKAPSSKISFEWLLELNIVIAVVRNGIIIHNKTEPFASIPHSVLCFAVTSSVVLHCHCSLVMGLCRNLQQMRLAVFCGICIVMLQLMLQKWQHFQSVMILF